MGKLSLLGDEWSPLRALSACGQILHKIQARVRPPPIQAMPAFWEYLVRQPIPNHHLTASPLDFSHRLGNIAMLWAQVDLISRLLNNHKQSLISNQKRAEIVIKASGFDNGGFICHEHKYNQHISGGWMKADWDKPKPISRELVMSRDSCEAL